MDRPYVKGPAGKPQTTDRVHVVRRKSAVGRVSSATVVELGSFDAAAKRLHVTPSAVSQRIKGLEQRVGQVLVVREKPRTATAAGVPLLRLAAQTALLEAEALAEMGGSDGTAARIALADNADSMSTWFTGVFSALDGVLFDIRIEDQDHSARLLREGVVMGAGDDGAHTGARLPGATAGSDALHPSGQQGYIKRYLTDGFTGHAVSEAPSLAWNRGDALQDELVRKAFRRHIGRPQHFVPTAEGFGSGLSWIGVGHVPGQPRRTASGRRVVRADLRCALGRTVVLAVLETRRSDSQEDHRCCEVSRRRPAPAHVAWATRGVGELVNE